MVFQKSLEGTTAKNGGGVATSNHFYVIFNEVSTAWKGQVPGVEPLAPGSKQLFRTFGRRIVSES